MNLFRRTPDPHEQPSPEERRRLDAHRLDAVEQHRVRAHVERAWPTAREFVCPTCEVSSSRAHCHRCGRDLSGLSGLPSPGSTAPVSPSPGAPLDGSAAAGRGTSSGRLARVAGEGPPGSDPTSNGGV